MSGDLNLDALGAMLVGRVYPATSATPDNLKITQLARTYTQAEMDQALKDARHGVPPLTADFWLMHRTAIIEAIGRAGYTLMSNQQGFWLQKMGKVEAQEAP